MTAQSVFPSPVELKKLPVGLLPDVATRIRSFLIERISTTGGHIGANLGVVELTIALHYVFDSPRDRLIFDTGHQGYTHKLLTEREPLFASLNTWKGMNRFVTRSESCHDSIDATHAGTSLSIAAGLAYGMMQQGSQRSVVAVIGDGSLVEGMAFEGLNFSADQRFPLIVLLNDNEMAIARSVGGIRNLTTGPQWIAKSRGFFEGLGFAYLAVPDGHDIAALVAALAAAQQMRRPVVVHAKTEKGRGLACARNHPYKMHFSMPFDPLTGKGASPTIAGRSYGAVAAAELLAIVRRDPAVYALTPATPYASFLDDCLREFPDRVLDVGMAEQAATGIACGLALAGMKPVVCYQTTFMQRAFDQILHDACFMELPVTFLGVRCGFSGYDGPTHHGLYDIPYLRSFPNLQVVYPVSSEHLRRTIAERLAAPEGAMVILYPYELIPDPEPEIPLPADGVAVMYPGPDGLIVTLGNRLVAACELRDALKTNCHADFGIACISAIKPFPTATFLRVCEPVRRLVTLEESTLPGGFGSLVAETLADAGVSKGLFRSGVRDRFVPGGTKDECAQECGISPKQVLDAMLEFWPDLRTVSQA